ESSGAAAGGAPGTKKGLHQVAAAGLDYTGSPYIDPADPTKPAQFVKDNQVSRMEGTVNQDLANKAEVCLGVGVYERAKQRAAQLHQAQTAAGGDAAASNAPWVPKMLRTDTSAT